MPLLKANKDTFKNKLCRKIKSLHFSHLHILHAEQELVVIETIACREESHLP